MSHAPATLLGLAATRLAFLVLPLLASWGSVALWYQVVGGRLRKAAAVAVWVLLSLTMLFALWHGWLMVGTLGFGIAFAVLLIWWQRLMPSNNRVWADDVAEMTIGSVEAGSVTLRNVRNFDWRSGVDYTPRWETRSYELEQLDSVDMILSYWSNRAIAHVLISFGFEGGEHVVFSVEIRRRKGEAFSEIGGFFKGFELSIIAADERDVIRLRTNVRREDDYLYQIRLPVAALRSLFLAYIDEANRLVQTPRFYNTITVNCTTLVYHMLKHIVGYLPWDIRVLFSGYLPGYVYRVGGLDSRYSLAELHAFGRITERARRSDRSGRFSTDIRQGMPTMERLSGAAAPSAQDDR
jgi:hypothetical protein